MPVGELGILLSKLSDDPVRKGREFERIAKWFLETDPRYVAELERIWLWDDWPGRWAADAGIDLVARDRSGGLWAIQVKAYSPTRSITKADVDTFLSESSRPQFSYRLLIASTNRLGTTARRTLDSQEKPTGRLLLGDLEEAPVTWPKSPRALRTGKALRKRLRPHQRNAVRDVVSGFVESDRGKLVMACGTGKTLVSLHVAEAMDARRVLVLLPSLSLLSQTLTEWTANSAAPIEFLAVCSDSKVVDDDAVVSTVGDLGFPVTTDPDAVAKFLRASCDGLKVVFSTYQSSPRVAQAMARSRVPQFDLAIADEAHRCAGRVSSDFATILDARAIRAKKRLFMTATPRYFTGRVVNEAKDSDFEIASMDDEAIFGPVLHRLTFSQAIEAGLLTDYQVVIVGVDDETYLHWAREGRFVTTDGTDVTDARALASQIGLAKAMRKYDLRRTISFHSRVSAARRFAEELPRVVEWMPSRQRPKGTLACDFVSGAMNAGQRNARLRRLREPETERALLANARCLTEGIDVPTLDAVAFIDPRRSEVDIVQAVGRAIRKAEDKKVGTIVIPVFVGSSDDPEDVLDSSAFKAVWDVINALRAHDEELAAELDAIRCLLGQRRGVRVDMPVKMHIDLPVGVSKRFSDQLHVTLVERTTSSWWLRFGALQSFARREGHCLVPQRHQEGDVLLGSWVNEQRQSRALMSTERVELLESLPGWEWDVLAARWESTFRRLEDYVAEFGTSLVPSSYRDNGGRLGAWVQHQRLSRAELPPNRAARLEALPGWSWDPHGEAWRAGFDVLVAYCARTGTSRVPFDHSEDGYPLGKWLAKQRSRQERMESDRRALLEALPGWSWDALGDRWEEAFALLQAYAGREGTARVPVAHFESGVRLGGWVDSQRQRRSRLSPQRAQRLSELPGWVWEPYADSWVEAFGRLQVFVAREGHSRVPKSHFEGDFNLGAWVNKQRSKRHSMQPARRAQLESLPAWVWDSRGK